ncbi:MAG: hypothetical protein A2513_07560 [Sulfurimonas sp. RIFOXYD12_FULL_33_39]|uniref:hypothetical protein n=1 Tax=unclassified Sulfurimonas TaxID=2623549 RepID=UPI0008B6E1CD|nr:MULTISPECIES: hypothetical protein [unclassified Sulfurimonas]OHE06214.1 MAG: hypothetical protein A3G74_04470 [Sulfurimonas sp. RIFCSPLOWO2_12_FULL_34_6]OHE09142.1 MAG: hypothetical protein A2513_07560 [Sulfurimonas sp. RIFOXYD12_FULL_33_39]OHE14459.1 MAG: hypothetical protein A2530_10620 [Sulfurimonas sp. RIFOXYD2_FULL_34_21]
MNRFIQALLTGIFITFILDFFLFLGILLNYINFHNIDLYYNILFADNQNGVIFFFLSVLLGFIVTYIKNYKISLITVGLLFFLSLLTLIESVGHYVGEAMFMKKNITLKDKKYSYTGDLYYEGRKEITFYDYNLKKIIKINKKDLDK